MWESEVERIRKLQAARLKEARKMRGFKSARAAQMRFGWSSAYGHHENGIRGIGRMYREYAKRFGVNPAWLLGHSDERDSIVRGVKVVADAAIGTWHEGPNRPSRTGRNEDVGVPSHGNGDEDRFAVRVADASMNKVLAQGAFAVCVPVEEDEEFKVGQIVYIERFRSGMMELSLRRIASITATAMRLSAYSVDPRYKQELTYSATTKNDERLRIVGRVVGKYEDIRP
jgi:hypothetical protein